MNNTGEFFINEINKVISEEQRENDSYQKFLHDYFREELKKDCVKIFVGFKEILDTEVEKYGDVLCKFKTTDSILMHTKTDLLDTIKNLSSVRFIEMDYPVSLIAPQEYVEGHGPSQDTDWNMRLIGAPYAWNLNATGSGVKLGIIDTGIDYNHPCLKDNVKGGHNFVDDSKDPFDDNGHGTHCAGIAAASGEASLTGVATRAELYALKVLSATGGGRTSGIVAAIDWAVSNGLQVLSMSLGSRFPASAMHEALIAAHERGLILVAASGNEMIGPGFPAFYREVVSVGAVDRNKKPASFTNRDPGVDIAAPGVGVYSSIPGGKFASYSGTSMACPHVSGVFTAILGERRMDNVEAENLIYDTAEDIKRHSWEVGRGLVRIDNGLKRL
ncbi:MAG: S8 family peptidase [Candidatus Eremiobacterota bacterium]